MRFVRLLGLFLALGCAPALAQVTPGTSPLSGAKGGTNNAFMQFSGPASSLKTYTLPNASDTLAALGQIQTWTGAQSFSDGKLILLGLTSGSTTLKAPATGGGTATLFPGSDTVMGVAAAQTPTNKVINCASNTCTVRLGSDVTGLLPLANIANGTQDTIIGYFGSTSISAISPGNCSNALTYSTSTHTFGCNATAGTGTVTTTGTPTAHQVAVVSGSTSITGAGPGVTGQALYSNGASADPTYKSGAWTLLNTLTANNTSATLTDTTSITSAYTEYEIVLEQVVPATNLATFSFQFQVSASFQTSSYLSNDMWGNGTTTGSDALTTGVLAARPGNIANTASGLSGRYILNNPAQTLTCKFLHGQGISNSGAAVIPFATGGCYNGGSGAYTGIQLITSAGNITSGVMKIYGRVN